jgi:DNA excision repair protein ERCC-4
MQHEFLTQQFAKRIAMRIAIDDRERTFRVKTALRRKGNVEISIKRLPLGDYRVDDTLIVERKTLADFALSVRDCRLFTQVGRLTRQRAMRACLILEGTADRYSRLAIPMPAFQGALITVTLVFGLPVLRSATPEETADLILFAANQLQRREVRPPRRRYKKTSTIRRHQSLLLQSIPEVGPKRAEVLLEAFGSPALVASATIDEIETVEGIGRHTSRKVWEVLHGTPHDTSDGDV